MGISMDYLDAQLQIAKLLAPNWNNAPTWNRDIFLSQASNLLDGEIKPRSLHRNIYNKPIYVKEITKVIKQYKRTKSV